ncbi:MAG: rhodanese-like domain-containing protein [Coriobacteriia bacterium]
MKKAIPWIVVVIVILGIAFFAFKPAATGTTVVDVKGVQKAATNGVRIVDVRSVGEFEGGHIPGAQNVPLDQLQSVASQWDKTAPVLVYCQTGARSAEAVSMLEGLGFTKILHFDKGIVAWTGSLEQGGGSSAAPSIAAAKPSATPVMYEFYTGW